MIGKDCVAIAAGNGNSTDQPSNAGTKSKSSDSNDIFKVEKRLFVGFLGRHLDILKVRNELSNRKNIYEWREKREITPLALANIMSNLLFEDRDGPLHIETIIAGIDQYTKAPYVCTIDAIGFKTVSTDFAAIGKKIQSLNGLCNTLYRPNLNSHQIYEVIVQTLVPAKDREPMKTWEATVMILQMDKQAEFFLKNGKINHHTL